MAHSTPPVRVASTAPIKASVEWRRNETMPLTFEPRFPVGSAIVATAPASLTLHAINRVTRTQPEPTIAEPVLIAASEPMVLRPAAAVAVARGRELRASAVSQQAAEKTVPVTAPKPVAPMPATAIAPDPAVPLVAMAALSRPIVPPAQPAAAPDLVPPVSAAVSPPKSFAYGTVRMTPAPAAQRAVTIAAPEIVMTESDEEPPPFYVPPSAPDYLDDSPPAPAAHPGTQPGRDDPPIRVALAAEPSLNDVATPSKSAVLGVVRIRLPRARPTVAVRGPARTVRPAPVVRKLAKAKRPRIVRRAVTQDPFGNPNSFSNNPNTFSNNPNTFRSNPNAFNGGWQQ